MKKVFFFLAAGAMGFTACTSEDVVDESVQANAIGFQNVVTKESRAVTAVNFNTFHVYGYYTKTDDANQTAVVNVFSDDVVTKGTDGWTYADTRYWVPGAKYYFYAYSCDNQDAPTGSPSLDLTGSDVKTRSLGLENYRCDNSHNHDLVFAYNEGNVEAGILGKQTGNENVSLAFKHVLSRLTVTFKSAFVPSYKIKISDVKIENVRNQGDFNVPDPDDVTAPRFAWSNVERVPNNSNPAISFAMRAGANEGDPVQEFAIAGKAAVGTQGQPGYEAAVDPVNALTERRYVIPFAYGEANVKLIFKITVMDDAGTVVYTDTMTGTWKPNWVLGTAYNYIITINPQEAGLQPIVFAAEQAIAGWSDNYPLSPDGSEAGSININMSFQSANNPTPTPAE